MENTTEFMIQESTPKAEPALREPVIGVWYTGISVRGIGAIAQYQGWGEFTLGDGTIADMTIYDRLIEGTRRSSV